jgi:hypothetical protein
MIVWCFVAFWLAVHFCCCITDTDCEKWRGWGIGLILILLASYLVGKVDGAQHSIVVNPFDKPEFSISAQSDGNILTIVPATCGKISWVEVVTDPPHEGIITIGGLYQVLTPATRGVFRCVICENNSCTPVEIFFTDVEVIGVDAPVPVEYDELWIFNEYVVIAVTYTLFFLACIGLYFFAVHVRKGYLDGY